MKIETCKMLTDGEEILVPSHVSIRVSQHEYGGLASLGACLGWTGQGCHERERVEGTKSELEV